MSSKATPPPPAYFLSLSLENVRSFGQKQTIHFTEGGKEGGRPAQWTIILGDNGVGKTTVLKSLAALAPIESPPTTGRYVPAYSDRWLFDWDLRRHDGTENAVLLAWVKSHRLISNKMGKPKKDYKFHSYMQIINPSSVFMSYAINSVEENPGVAGLICYGYGAGRTIGNSGLSDNRNESVTFESLFDERADLLNPEEWFLQMEYSSLKQDKQAAVALDKVRQVLLQVLPDITDIHIGSKGYQQYLELKSPYGWVRLRDMSLGYQTLVVWLTDFASKLFIRYPNSPNPLEEPAIVLIDEIDLHLHPSWQRKLIGFLSGIFKNTQFIATAHSPLVVQAAGDQPGGANVVLLKREGDQTVVRQGADLPDVHRWRLDQIMTSELFDQETARSPQTEDLLAQRAALLTKTNRTEAENQQLAELTRELDQQPLGETPSEQHINAVLQQLRQKLGPNPTDAPAA